MRKSSVGLVVTAAIGMVTSAPRIEAGDRFTPEQRKRMNEWKPRTAAEQAAIIKRGDRTIRTYSGTSGGMKVQGCRSNWKPGDYGYDPAKHSCGSRSVKIDGVSGSETGGGGGSSIQVERPWKYRVKMARADVGAIPADQLEASLERGDDARIFALLERAYRKKVVLSEGALVRALRRSQEPKVAYAAAYQLSGHRTPSARKVLARHVARGAPGHREVRKLLGEGAAAEVEAAKVEIAKRSEWMKDAATGTPGGRFQLRAIRALATEPGGDVEALLKQLARDTDKDVSEPAQAALEKRREAGL